MPDCGKGKHKRPDGAVDARQAECMKKKRERRKP